MGASSAGTDAAADDAVGEGAAGGQCDKMYSPWYLLVLEKH